MHDSSSTQDSSEFSPLRSVHSTSLTELLKTLGVSLAVSTYQAGRLVVLRADTDSVNTHFCSLEAPMGLAYDGTRFAVGTRTQVIEFRNQPIAGRKIKPQGKYDACFMPRRSHTTGDIRGHEMGWIGHQLWIVNTRFSCLSTLEPDYSFVPQWRPPFVTALAAEDRCHLNGMAIVDGAPKYVSALGTTDSRQGWRENKAFGGCLIDVASGETIASGLSMPHSPRVYGGHVWLLESGRGAISTVDLATGELTTVATLPGFTRGLDFVGHYAFVGLSQVRETATFSGIPITQSKDERCCGVWVVDLRNGKTVAFLKFEDAVQEIFAIQVLGGFRYPELRNSDNDSENLIPDSFVLPDDSLKEVAGHGRQG